MAARKPRKRKSHFAQLHAKALENRVGGHEQHRLIDWLTRQGFTHSRSIWIGRVRLAKLLGKDPWDTRDRLKRLEAKGLLRCVVGGGRRRGCRKAKLIGLANRYYPGTELLPAVITDGWIREDNERQRQKFEPAAVQEEAPWAAAVERVRQKFSGTDPPPE